MKSNQGFTLVELLAVIVILAIIMIITIPSVLNTMAMASQKTFDEFALKTVNEAQKQTMLNDINGESMSSECIIYDIKTDLGLSSTDDFKGYVLVKKNNSQTIYYITLYDKNYMLLPYNFTDNINSNYENTDLNTSLIRYEESKTNLISKENLCNYGCDYCVYKEGEEYEGLNGDPTKTNGVAFLKNGPTFNSIMISLAGSSDNIEYVKKSNTLKEGATIASTIDEQSNINPFYIWYESGDKTIYFYTDAKKVFLNSDSSDMFRDLTNLKDIDDFKKMLKQTY